MSYTSTILGVSSKLTKPKREAAHNDKLEWFDTNDEHRLVFKDLIEEACDVVWLATITIKF